MDEEKNNPQENPNPNQGMEQEGQNQSMGSNTQGNKNASMWVVIVLAAIVIIAALIFWAMGRENGTEVPDPVSPGEETSEVSLNEEQEEIVQAIIDADTIMRSGNIGEIRDFLSLHNPEDQVSMLSDQDLTQGSQLYAAMMPEITVAYFSRSNVTWDIEGDQAVVTVMEEDGEASFELTRIDGEWSVVPLL